MGVHGAAHYAIVKIESTPKDSNQLPKSQKQGEIVMKWSFGKHISLLLLTAFYMLVPNVGTIWAPIKTFNNPAAAC